MAELGAASAVVGIASFALQVFGSINTLKAVYQYNQRDAPENIKDIVDRLEFLKLTLDTLQSFEGNPIVDHAIRSCQSTFINVEKDLGLLLEKVQRKTSNKKIDWKSFKIQLSGKIRERIEEIKSKLIWVTIMLNVSSSVCAILPSPSGDGISQTVNTLLSPDNIPADDENIHSGNITTVVSSSALSRSRDLSRSQLKSCIVRHCHCSCHLTQNSLGRYWGFEYTPLSVMFGKCDIKRCDMKSNRWKFRLALNKFSISWAFVMDFELTLRAETYTLRPALSVQRVVKYTSPGFETLWKCRRSIISLSEAQDNLRALNRSSPLRQHINPGGNNYIRELLCDGPWFGHQTDQFAFLSFLVDELGMRLENEDNKFLAQCASWVGEGRHLDLLSIILDLGFDPSGADSPLFQSWPSLCAYSSIWEARIPDPFFVEYLGIIAKDTPNFGGSTNLQDAILCGSVTTVPSLLSNTAQLENHRNFLGQTPLHLAVQNLEIFKMVLDAGHDMDVTDKWGVTPLMYAAAKGQEKIVKLLISKGANITVIATPDDRNFMDYASARGHWDLIFESLNMIQQYHTDQFQQYLYEAMYHWTDDTYWLDESRRAEYFERLLRLCEEASLTSMENFRDPEENNLLHFVRSEKEFQALIHHGFQGFNEPNNDGEIPLYSIVRRARVPSLIEFCLNNGTDINHINHSGRTVLMELLRRLGNIGPSIWDTVDSIRLCLDRGLDISHTDSCMCACSIDGCGTSAVFSMNFTPSWYRYGPDLIFAFEWLSIVEESCGYEESRALILSFIRRLRFDLLDITHVCCHRGESLGEIRQSYSQPSPDDTQEILDEEQEIIDILEEEMRGYHSETLDKLRSEWMRLLKQKDDNAAAETQRKRNPIPNETCEYIVDHKADTYQYMLKMPSHSNTIVTWLSGMYRYAFWLQYEYLRTRDHPENTHHKKGWYERRILWLAELVSVLGISNQQIKQEMEKICVETGSEKIDAKAVVEQLLISMKAGASKHLLIDNL